MRRILRAGIVYLIIPRLTAFASFHTTQCNNSTNVPRDECTDIAGYHWTIKFSVLIIASTSEMITFHLRAVRGMRVWHRCQPFCGCIPYTRTHASSTNVTMQERSFVAMLHQRSHTKGHHACAIRPLSHGTSVNKQGSFQAKYYASVRFCRRPRPTKKFLNVCENFARNVGHVKHYCPFTRSSFCNISQTLRKFCKECFFFFVVWKGLKSII